MSRLQLEEYRDSSVDNAEVIQVIKVVSIFGEGEERSPIRQITEYYSLDGKRLARSQDDSHYFPVLKPKTEIPSQSKRQRKE